MNEWMNGKWKERVYGVANYKLMFFMNKRFERPFSWEIPLSHTNTVNTYILFPFDTLNEFGRKAAASHACDEQGHPHHFGSFQKEKIVITLWKDTCGPMGGCHPHPSQSVYIYLYLILGAARHANFKNEWKTTRNLQMNNYLKQIIHHINLLLAQTVCITLIWSKQKLGQVCP